MIPSPWPSKFRNSAKCYMTSYGGDLEALEFTPKWKFLEYSPKNVANLNLVIKYPYFFTHEIYFK